MGNIQIKQHLSKQHKLKSERATFTCEICTEPKPNERMFKNKKKKNCRHPFCIDCMIKYIQVKLEQHESDIRCPDINCNKLLDSLHCRPLIPSQLYVKWCDVLLFNSVVYKSDSWVYCPNRDCGELILNECSDWRLRRYIKEVPCPKCKKLFCFRCAVPWHAGLSCNHMQNDDDLALTVLADQERWMTCPTCRNLVELSYGCSIVRCRCGTRFCYDCGKTIWACNCQSVLSKIGRLGL